MIRQKLVPALLVLFSAYSFFFFIFGDLGILASYEKTVRIRELRHELDKLSLKRLKKKQKLKRIKEDPATIRQYALLYGLKGGEKLPPPGSSEEERIERILRTLKKPEKGAFLLRHPLLIILALLISMSLFAYFLFHRRHRIHLEENAPPRNRSHGGHSGSYINPSWG